ANTEALLTLLKTEPSLEDLQSEAAKLRIGQDKGRLISAYAKRHAADANYGREKMLREQNLATQAALLSAQEAHNSAIAEYLSVFEDIDFRFSVDLMQAEQGLRVAESAVSNADRRLHILGMSQEQIDAIESEVDTAISRYELHAPIAGRIVMKHLSIGERVTEEEAAYSIANLSTVWLNVSVYAKYFHEISEGQTATIVADGRKASGRISYVSSAVSEETRTIIARIVVNNTDRLWRPGEFVTVQLETSNNEVPRAAPIEAVQVYEGHDVVFVRDKDGIEPYTVELGRRNHVTIELVSGPPVGTLIVVRNSFLIKAELGKSAAGHGH
ncbi:MAG: efflux RND transporter periplasmic adaptor subunit, partial [Gammaproteobacteria bacterium]|nr:efflux RND transporter periplasmic adaptor subunit [Gammaproteobacteria bacterium]